MTGARLGVGRIDRAQGLRGDLIVTLSTNRLERLAPGAVLYAGDRRLVVLSSRPHGPRFTVHFEGVDDKDAADRLHGAELFAERLDDPDEIWVHDLIGAEVVDQLGTARGRVVAVLANPASDLLELDSGALVPMRFVVDHVPAELVRVDAPEGLFE